jgi:general secretion pathway protein C
MTRIYFTLFNLVALSVIIFAGVDIFYRLVRAELGQINTTEIVMQQTPETKRYTSSPLDDFRAIADRNIFGSLQKTSLEQGTEEIEALEPTSLKIALLGTVTGNDKYAFAVIEESDKRAQGLYKVGDSVQEAVVKRILRGKVVLRVGDKDEVLTMEESSSSKKETPPPTKETSLRRFTSRPTGRESSIVVNRKDLQKSLQNMNELLTQVRIRPHFKDGRADGLSITRITRGSIFAKLGLRNGDIVQGINGRSITSPDDVLALYEQLNSGTPMSLEITRRNQQRTINYRFR